MAILGDEIIGDGYFGIVSPYTPSSLLGILNQFVRYLHKINDIDIVQYCGLAKGTAATTLQTTREIVYFLYNDQITKVVTDNITLTACAEQAISTFCYYLVSIDLNKTIIVTKGTNNTYSLPVTPQGQVAIGAFKIVTDASHTFISGTTDLSSAGITFYDIDCGIATTLINYAMRGIERKYNLRGMKVRTPYSLAVSTNTFNNPMPYYKELIKDGGVYAMDSNNKRYAMNKYDVDTVEGAFAPTQTGAPAMIAEVPESQSSLSFYTIPNLKWIIRPYADKTYTIIFTAYQYTPYLDNVIYTDNWWTINHPDVLVYGALVEAELYLKNDNRSTIWKKYFDEKLIDLLKSELDEEYAGASKFVQGN